MYKLIAILFAASFLNTSNPEIGFDDDKFNFGKVKLNSMVTHNFIVYNKGDQPLILTKVVPSCGCTVASFTKEPIKPGGQGEIAVKFNTKYRPLGFSLKTFTVFSNSKNAPHTIWLKGEITKN